jgi:hypothetical protein
MGQKHREGRKSVKAMRGHGTRKGAPNIHWPQLDPYAPWKTIPGTLLQADHVTTITLTNELELSSRVSTSLVVSLHTAQLCQTPQLTYTGILATKSFRRAIILHTHGGIWVSGILMTFLRVDTESDSRARKKEVRLDDLCAALGIMAAQKVMKAFKL